MTQEVSTRVKAIYKEHGAIHREDTMRPGRATQSWREWIYYESLRRFVSYSYAAHRNHHR